MKKAPKGKSRPIEPGGVSEYIAKWPREIQTKLRNIRSIIRSLAPDAIETMSYFDMPGYSYEGYDYNGMFVWFSYKPPFVRLHVRPKALVQHRKALAGFRKTKAIVCLPSEGGIPKMLVRKLVMSSLKEMKRAAK